MKFGVCRGLDDLSAMKAAKEAGADYFETGFCCLANYDEEKFNEGKAMLDSLGLPCYAANGFIPGDMPIVGEEVDYDAIADYLDRGFDRAKKLGVKVIVLGSGKARSFPEGYSPDKAKEQLVFFLREYASPRAEKAGCIIVLEPLRFCESAMIHTVADGVEIAKLSGRDNVFGLADLYHVYGNDDSIDGIKDFKGLVRHSHVAEPVKRVYPSKDDSVEIKSMYKCFFDALKSAGCETCSVEAHTDDFTGEIGETLSFLKSVDNM